MTPLENISTASSFRVRQNGGFSLTELVVAIVLLGMVASVLFTAMAEQRQAIYDAECRTLLRQWGEAIRLYADENDGYYATRGSGAIGWYDAWPSIATDYQNYIGLPGRGRDLRTCPTGDDPIGSVTYAMTFPFFHQFPRFADA